MGLISRQLPFRTFDFELRNSLAHVSSQINSNAVSYLLSNGTVTLDKGQMPDQWMVVKCCSECNGQPSIPWKQITLSPSVAEY